MKIFRICATLLIVATCTAAVAQSPAAEQPSREDVLKMFDAMHLRKQMDQLMVMMTAQMKQQLHATVQKQFPSMSAADEQKLEASADNAMTIYPVSEMLNDIIPIYQRHMTKSDVDAIIAFYGSPAGQHLLVESPVMMQETMNTVMPKVNARVQSYVNSILKNAGPADPGPPPTNP